MAVDITYVVECKRVGNALLLYCWVWQCIAIRTASPSMAEKLEEVKARRGRAAEGRNRQNLQKYCFINLFEQQQKALLRFALMLLAVEDSEVKTSHWWNLRKSNEINFNFQLQQWLGKRAWVQTSHLSKKIRDRNFRPQKFTQKSVNWDKKRNRDKIAYML